MNKKQYYIPYFYASKMESGVAACTAVLDSPLTEKAIGYMQEKLEQRKGARVVILNFIPFESVSDE